MKEIFIGLPVVLLFFGAITAMALYNPFLLIMAMIGGFLLALAYVVGCIFTGKV